MSDLMGGFMHAIETINGGSSSAGGASEAQPGAGIGQSAHAYSVGYHDGKTGQIGSCFPSPYDFDYDRGYKDGQAANLASFGGIEEDKGTGMTLQQALKKEYDEDPRAPILKDKDPKYESLGEGFPEEPGGPDKVAPVGFGHEPSPAQKALWPNYFD